MHADAMISEERQVDVSGTTSSVPPTKKRVREGGEMEERGRTSGSAGWVRGGLGLNCAE